MYLQDRVRSHRNSGTGGYKSFEQGINQTPKLANLLYFCSLRDLGMFALGGTELLKYSAHGQTMGQPGASNN